MNPLFVRHFGWVLYSAYIVGIIILPELGARVVAKVTYAPPAKSRYIQVSQPYPLLQQLISDWTALRFVYHDYYVYSPAPASSQTVNFTDYFGARLTPDSVSPDTSQHVVWTFGGSTMQNLEADDRLTLANQIAAELNKRVSCYITLGAGDFKAPWRRSNFKIFSGKFLQASAPLRPSSMMGSTRRCTGITSGRAPCRRTYRSRCVIWWSESIAD
jgi:hypothetical protein